MLIISFLRLRGGSSKRTFFIQRLIWILVVCGGRNVCGNSGVHMVKSPEDSVAPEGDEVIFECELSIPPEKLIWRFQSDAKNDGEFRNLEENGEDGGYNISNEEVTSKLRIYVRPSNIGVYQCVAWYGPNAIASLPAKLTLASIRLNTSNELTKSIWRVPPGNTVVIRCGSVVSNPSAIWSFYKNDAQIHNPQKLPATDYLVLNSVGYSDTGIYSCIAINLITEEKITLPQTIDLRVEGHNKTAPYFPSAATAAATVVQAPVGQSTLLECIGVGNPPPKHIWKHEFRHRIIDNSRIKILPNGLYFSSLVEEDRGTYQCILDNGLVPTSNKTITLAVLTKPVIVNGISREDHNVKEDDSKTLECEATGFPEPRIYWMINGVLLKNDKSIKQFGNKITFKSAKKHHAGNLQCFAKNIVGEVFETALLKVIPLTISNGRSVKSHKPAPSNVGYIAPSPPTVTKLSDTSVMLQWFVPYNNGLRIQYFRIQYRMFGNKTLGKQNWQTLTDQILSNPTQNYTQEVVDLNTDATYKFRVLAVYSNNDNKEGDTSVKFHLHKCNKKSCTLQHPIIRRVEGISDSEIQLQWDLAPSHREHRAIDGFYLYYRPVESAGNYLITTIKGNHTRRIIINGLRENTSYEFKMKSYSTSFTSNFSEISSVKTNKTITTTIATTTKSTTLPPPEANKLSIYAIIGIVIGSLFLLFLGLTVCVYKFQKRNGNFFKTPADDGTLKPNVNLHHHTHLNLNNSNKNGSSKDPNIRINITSNPLDQQIEV